MQIVAASPHCRDAAVMRAERRTRPCDNMLPVDRSLLQNGSVTLQVWGKHLDQIEDASQDAITLFHHGPSGRDGDTALTISLLGDGTIRAIHRCDGDVFELRGGRVPSNGVVAVVYQWGSEGSCLSVNDTPVDSSLAVLTLPRSPESYVRLDLVREEDRLTTPVHSDQMVDDWVPTEMTM